MREGILLSKDSHGWGSGQTNSPTERAQEIFIDVNDRICWNNVQISALNDWGKW